MNYFLEAFQKMIALDKGIHPEWVLSERKKAFDIFQSLGLPNTHLENWKYTNLTGLNDIPFQTNLSSDNFSLSFIKNRVKLTPNALSIWFVDGRYNPETTASSESNVTLHPLRFPENQTAFISLPDSDALTHLNQAFLNEGVSISVSPHTFLNQPIELILVQTGTFENLYMPLRIQLHLAAESQASIIVRTIQLKETPCFYHPLIQIHLERGSHLNYSEWIQSGEAGIFVGSVSVHQEKNSHFQAHTFAHHSRLCRHEIHVHSADIHTHTHLYGLGIGYGQEHIDFQTDIHHHHSFGTSDQLYKMVMGDQAFGVFDGKIEVHPNTQKITAFQHNHNLLLASSANIRTKPSLQIKSEDVRCSHGATVGQMDKEALFYLQSRGIPYEEAKDMIIEAFANQVIQTVGNESLRKQLELHFGKTSNKESSNASISL